MTIKQFQSQQKRAAAPLVVTGGDKGGVGKSFQARVLAWQLQLRGIPLALCDGDERNAHLERHYSSQLSAVRFDARSEAGWTSMFNHLDNVSADHAVVVDLPAGAGGILHREAARLIANEGLGMPTIHVWVAAPGEDSVRLFRDLMTIAPASRTAFVMNKRSDENLGRFDIWMNSRTRAEFLAEGGLEVTLPKLLQRPHDMIANERLPFPSERPVNWLRGDWFTFLSFKAAVEREQASLIRLIQEMC